jgi:hypothetical protein
VSVEVTETDAKARGEVLAETRRKKMEALFGDGRKYEVVKEVHVPEGEPRFSTPFGNKGLHGFHIRQIGGPEVTGIEDLDPRGFIVGKTVLQKVADEYNAVALPPRKRRKRKTDEVSTPEVASE